MLSKLIATAAALAIVCATSTGCAALIDAGFKETDDHGSHAAYENKSYGEHFLDSLLEGDDDDDGCHDTTVIVVHEEG